jgi:hypothetical protein
MQGRQSHQGVVGATIVDADHFPGFGDPLHDGGRADVQGGEALRFVVAGDDERLCRLWEGRAVAEWLTRFLPYS